MKEDEMNKTLYASLRKIGHFLFVYTGVKTGQRRALIRLDEDGEMTQRDLQKKLGIRSSTMAETIAKMQNEALVERRKDDADQRKVLVKLTPRGEEAATSQKDQLTKINTELFSNLSSQEKETFITLLNKLNHHLEALKNDDQFLNQIEGVK